MQCNHDFCNFNVSGIYLLRPRIARSLGHFTTCVKYGTWLFARRLRRFTTCAKYGTWRLAVSPCWTCCRCPLCLPSVMNLSPLRHVPNSLCAAAWCPPYYPQARAQNWRGLYHLIQAFGERFEQRDPKAGRAGAGLALAGVSGGSSRSSALLLPNWFEDAAEYRLKKALVSMRMPFP